MWTSNNIACKQDNWELATWSHRSSGAPAVLVTYLGFSYFSPCCNRMLGWYLRQPVHQEAEKGECCAQIEFSFLFGLKAQPRGWYCPHAGRLFLLQLSQSRQPLAARTRVTLHAGWLTFSRNHHALLGHFSIFKRMFILCGFVGLSVCPSGFLKVACSRLTSEPLWASGKLFPCS